MNFNKIRRIVSGKKSRFVTDDGLELDLCYVTDRIIICGLPASGIEALYRNDRQTVRQFLTSRYGEHYRIFNFCPRFENGYDAAYFNNQVSRYPFPDHHPPPLSLIPLAVRRMHDWLLEDERNVVVIHCKAGKGRSGTMCCCYLLSLPSLPSPPKLAQNISAKVKAAKAMPKAAGSAGSSRSSLATPVDSDSEDDAAAPPRAQSGGAALDLEGHRGDKRNKAGRAKIEKLVENLASSGDEQALDDGEEDRDSDRENGAANQEASGIADKLNEVFNLHTAQRMNPKYIANEQGETEKVGTSDPPKKPVRGVSIPSQRRFVGYWSRVLSKQDPRPLDLLAPPNPTRIERNRRQVYVTSIRVYMPETMPGFPSLVNKKAINIHLGRYKTSFVDELEKWDLNLREMRRLEKRLKREGALEADLQKRLDELETAWAAWDDDKWDDKAKMFEGEGILVENPPEEMAAGPSGSYPGFRYLTPKPDGSSLQVRQAVDADREVQFKILIGESGKKHSILPDVGSLGYIWVIPSFHLSLPVNIDQPESLKYTISLDNREIDFFKAQSGIEKVEIDLEWSVY